MTGNRTRFVSAALFAGVVLVAVFLALLPRTPEHSRGSIFSTERNGSRALVLLLRRLGWNAEPWTRVPADLSQGPRVLWLGGSPKLPPGYEGGQVRGGTRDPANYARFMEEGGTLIAVMNRDLREFLVDHLELFAEGDLPVLTGRLTTAERREDFNLPWDESLSIAPAYRFEPVFENPLFDPFLMDAEGRAFIVRAPVERGELILLADSSPTRNRGIGDAQNALALVRLFESIAPPGAGENRRTVYFDEYSLGGWVPESALDLAISPRAIGFTLHVAGFLLLLLVSVVWVRGFPRDPVLHTLLSPLDRARSWAAWIGAEGRWDLLGRLLRLGVLRRLAGRSGQRLGDAEQALDPDKVAAVIGAYRARLGGDEGVARARRLLLDKGVASEEDLATLGRRLAALELELGIGESALPAGKERHK